jgi:hypothetical protein
MSIPRTSLISALLVVYVPPEMRSRSSILCALLLTLVWLMALLHVGLEANGLLMEHDHQFAPHSHMETASAGDHGHSGHDHSEPTPGADTHDPFVARVIGSDARGVASPCLLLACAFPFVSAVLWLAIRLSIAAVARFALPLIPEHHAPAEWHFVRRCVAESLAPPPLV